jgi:hypothetical protein
MKRTLLFLILVVALAALPFAAACAAEEPAAPAQPARTDILIGGSGPGGAFYPLSCGVMTVVNENVPGVRATAIAVGATANFRQMLQGGEMAVALHEISFAEGAYRGGTEQFADANPQLRWLVTCHGNWSFFITLDSDIKTLYDVEGKSIAVGGPESADPPIAYSIFSSLGLEKDVDYKAVLLDGHEAVDAMIDGRVDVVFTTGGRSCPAVAEVDAAKTVYFLSFPEDKWDVMLADLEAGGIGQQRGMVPADLYNGLDSDYDTLVSLCALFTTENQDEDLIYKVTKAVWENMETIILAHPAGAEWSLDNVKQGMKIPIHPGALKYYQEIGVLTEDPFKG